MSRIALVVAVARNGVIGRDGTIPWHVSTDLKLFKAITMGKPVIMGRKTWESLPKRPLPGRVNIVVTGTPGFRAEGALVAASPMAALELARQSSPEEIGVIGGGAIYRALLPVADRIYLSEVDLAVEGDTVFPALSPGEWRETERQTYPPGPRDAAGFTLIILDRVAG